MGRSFNPLATPGRWLRSVRVWRRFLFAYRGHGHQPAAQILDQQPVAAFGENLFALHPFLSTQAVADSSLLRVFVLLLRHPAQRCVERTCLLSIALLNSPHIAVVGP